MNDAEGVRVRVRQNTEPNAEQRRLLSAMAVKLERNQQLGRWPEGVESHRSSDITNDSKILCF